MEKRTKKPKQVITHTDLFDKEIPSAKNKDGTPSVVYQKEKWKGLSRKDRKRLKKNGDKAFMITMMFSNGTCREFVIIGKTEYFDYRKRTYYLRYEDSWFNLTQNQFELFFFDDCPVPISREIMKKGDKKFFSVTPENLKPLIKMEYVKALASSDDVIRKVKTILVLVIVGLALMGINLLVTFGVSGKIK